jgi:hypothetical protein
MTRFHALILLLLVGLTSEAFAISVKPYYQDIKLPTQAMLESQTIPAPIVAAANTILNANAGDVTGSTPVTVTTFAAQPDVPRNITVTPGGTTADVVAGNVVVTGTDIFGAALTENLAVGNAQSTATVGNKAFKTITSIQIPAEAAGHAATWSVGVGSKLGLKRCMSQAGNVAWATFNGAYEATRGTAAVSATAVSGNTYTPNGTMDGTKDVTVFFVQNFQCFP